MTQKGYTHLAVLVDRSGSMAMIKNDMIGGLDSLFKEQAAQPGKCLVDYAQFDDTYELLFEDKWVAEAKAVLSPRGSTALLDGIGKIVTYLGDKLNTYNEKDKPEKVIVVVITDGWENASKEWSRESVKALITQQREEWQWEFVFLGASEDALDVAQSYGFAADSSMQYNTTKSGVTSQVLSGYVSQTRSTGKGAFSEKDREDVK